MLIVGAGPAGLGAAALLKKCGVPCVVIERGRIGESFLSWQDQLVVMIPPFPLYGPLAVPVRCISYMTRFAVESGTRRVPIAPICDLGKRSF